MILVQPFINTNHSNKFKDFVLKPFVVSQFDKTFYGWRGKSMVNWHRFINDYDVVLEFYPNYYTIKQKNETHKIISPNTINDFINDMHRYSIKLYWNDNIYNELEPKDILSEKDIYSHYKNLLKTIDKSFELK